MAFSPYLAVTLDAKRRLDRTERALELPRGLVHVGFLELLEHVWERKDPHVSALVVAACFGPDPRIPDALVTFGFLVPDGDGWTLEPEEADRLLKTYKQRVEAGRARAAVAKRAADGTLQRSTSEKTSDTSDAASGEPAGSQRQTSGQPAAEPALASGSPSTQHPAPSTLDLAAGAAVPVESPEAPPTPAQKPRQRAQAPARATNGAPPLVLEPQTPHEPDRARQELIRELGAVFQRVRGATYAYQPRDWRALDRIRALPGVTSEMVLERWRRGLEAQFKARCDSIFDLEARWNANATPEKKAGTAQERAAESRDTSRDWSTWDGEF